MARISAVVRRCSAGADGTCRLGELAVWEAWEVWAGGWRGRRGRVGVEGEVMRSRLSAGFARLVARLADPQVAGDTVQLDRLPRRPGPGRCCCRRAGRVTVRGRVEVRLTADPMHLDGAGGLGWHHEVHVPRDRGELIRTAAQGSLQEQIAADGGAAHAGQVGFAQADIPGDGLQAQLAGTARPR